MLGSAKTNWPLLTLTSWVKGTSSFLHMANLFSKDIIREICDEYELWFADWYIFLSDWWETFQNLLTISSKRSLVAISIGLSFRLYWTVCWSVRPASSVQNLLWINWKLWLWWKLLLLFWFWDWCYWSDLVTTLFDIRDPCSNNWQRLALRPEQDLKMIKISDIIRISSLLKRKTGGLGRWLLYLIISEYHRKQEDLDGYDYSYQKENRN